MGGLSLSGSQGSSLTRLDEGEDDASGDLLAFGDVMRLGRLLPRPWGLSPMDDFRYGFRYLTVTELTSPSWSVTLFRSVGCSNIDQV